jgi:hypothetical protein
MRFDTEYVVALEKRIKELEADRNDWTQKAFAQMHRVKELEAELQTARKLIEEVYSQCPDENDWFKQAGDWLRREK